MRVQVGPKPVRKRHRLESLSAGQLRPLRRLDEPGRSAHPQRRGMRPAPADASDDFHRITGRRRVVALGSGLVLRSRGLNGRFNRLRAASFSVGSSSPISAATIARTSSAVAIPASARALAESSISTSTRRAYAGALRRLDAWVNGRNLDDAALAVYVAELHTAGKSPASINLAVSAVRFRAKITGAPSPIGPATDRVLAGARRASQDRGRGQVAGIRWEQADTAAAVSANGGGSVARLRDAAILVVMSDAMLRVSEAAALDVADLDAEADGTGRLTIRRSKSDQEGKGAVARLRPDA